MFLCPCPSLGCELLQVRDLLSHLLFPVLVVGIGTMQRLLGKYLVKSLPNQTGSPCTLACGSSLVTRLLWVAHLREVRHAVTSVTLLCHASHCWFSSSPFSLSVLENHKETPCCSWNSCRCDSGGIEHMELCPYTTRDVATFSSVASFLCQPGSLFG